MRIALLTDTFVQPNGVSKHVNLLASKLTEMGQEVAVYTGSGSSKKFRVVNLPHVMAPLTPEYEIIFTLGKKVDADVVHAHSPYFTARLAARSGRPYVTTTHTSPSHMFSFLHLDVLAPLGWRYLVAFHNRSDHVICQTRATERLFREHGLDRPTSIISVGLDLKRFGQGRAARFRKKFGIDGDFVFSTCRLSAEKRPEWLLRACDELGIPLVLISDGPLRGGLERRYPRARFLGYVSDEDKYDGYAAASILALASSDETEGLTVSEAMATETAVIATRLPAIADNVRDGKNGLLFRDYPEFKRKLSLLWEDKKLRAGLAKEALRSVREKDINVVARRILGVYEAL